MHYTWNGRAKVGHNSLESAEAHLLSLIKKQPIDKNAMGIYLCWCKNYHVGHLGKQRTDPLLERNVGKIIGILRKHNNKENHVQTN